MRILPLIIILLSFCSCKRDFFKVVSASYAKEFCSCLYVEKQGPQTCEQYAKQIIQVHKFHIDEQKKMVEAKWMGFRAISFYRGKRLGCSLP